MCSSLTNEITMFETRFSELHEKQECSDNISECMQSQGHNEIINQRSDRNKDKTCMHCKLDSATIILTTKCRITSRLNYR
jgi:RNA binding exosome subunit